MNSNIAALVGSRICHDLISPIGAIGNGVELLALTDGDTTDEMALVSDSVENANARIRYFRIAYGAATADQFVSRTETLSIMSAVAKSGRLTYFWRVDGEQLRQDVRAAFLMMQCFETAMPFGGDVNIERVRDKWVLQATTDRLIYEDALWESLSPRGAPYDHSPAQVQFALFPTALQECRRTLTLDRTDKSITATF